MNSGELLDRRVLSHIARYWLTFQEIVRHVYCPGADPQKVLNSLRQQELIEARPGFGGNRRAYYLTAKGARLVGVSPKRAVPAGADALQTHFSLLGFCCLVGRARIRLESDEVEATLGGVPPGRYHCLDCCQGAPRIYEAYVPGETTPPHKVVDRVRKSTADARSHGFLVPWIEARLYGHAVIVESQERCLALARLFSEELPNEAVLVERVPDAAQLEGALHGLA